MPGHKLSRSRGKLVNPRKKSHKIIKTYSPATQYGGGNYSVSNEVLSDVINKKANADAKYYQLEPLPITELNSSGYDTLTTDDYMCVNYRKGNDLLQYIIQVDKQTSGIKIINVYGFLDAEDKLVSKTMGERVLKLCEPRNVGFKLGYKLDTKLSMEDMILDIDGTQKEYKNSRLYKEKVYPKIHEASNKKEVTFGSGPGTVKKSLNASALKKLSKYEIKTPMRAKTELESKLKTEASAAATPAAAGTKDIILPNDYLENGPFEFDDILQVNEFKDIPGKSSFVYPNHAAIFADYDVSGNEINEVWLLHKKARHTGASGLNKDYYVLKKFYGNDDILVICQIPNPDAKGNINIGQPYIYEDSTDNVVDIKPDGTCNDKKTKFDGSNVLLKCLKAYIILHIDNTIQDNLDTYTQNYITASQIRAGRHFDDYFSISEPGHFNTTGLSKNRYIIYKDTANNSEPDPNKIYRIVPYLDYMGNKQYAMLKIRRLSDFFKKQISGTDIILDQLNSATVANYPEDIDFVNSAFA
jgi:hypothetical protein